MRIGAALQAILATLVLAGCADPPPSFRGSYSSDGFVSITDGPAQPGAFVFTLRKVSAGTKEVPVYPRPGGALLKVPGFLPLAMDSIEDRGDSYVVTIFIPEEMLRDPRLAQSRSLEGELFLPVDHGVRSFTGIERFVPDTQRVATRITPQHPVRFPWLAEAIGEFFRGLYSAR